MIGARALGLDGDRRLEHARPAQRLEVVEEDRPVGDRHEVLGAGPHARPRPVVGRAAGEDQCLRDLHAQQRRGGARFQPRPSERLLRTECGQAAARSSGSLERDRLAVEAQRRLGRLDRRRRSRAELRVRARRRAGADGAREVLQLEAERLRRLDARDDDVAAAVAELVLAEVRRARRTPCRGRRRAPTRRRRCRRTGPSAGCRRSPSRAPCAGASHEIWTLAVTPLAKVSVMNATSGLCSRKMLRADALTCVDRLVEQVEQDREVVRREVADDAVGLVLAEVHARRGDEVHLAERVLSGSARGPC